MVSQHQIDENFYETRNIACDLDWLVIYHLCKLVNLHKPVFNYKNGVLGSVS